MIKQWNRYILVVKTLHSYCTCSRNMYIRDKCLNARDIIHIHILYIPSCVVFKMYIDIRDL